LRHLSKEGWRWYRRGRATFVLDLGASLEQYESSIKGEIALVNECFVIRVAVHVRHVNEGVPDLRANLV
jgi:hypothetical protein